MGCRIIEGTKDGGHSTCAVFYCSTTEWAFGPVMQDSDEADAFLKYLKEDPRTYSQFKLEDEYETFRKESHVSTFEKQEPINPDR